MSIDPSILNIREMMEVSQNSCFVTKVLCQLPTYLMQTLLYLGLAPPEKTADPNIVGNVGVGFEDDDDGVSLDILGYGAYGPSCISPMYEPTTSRHGSLHHIILFFFLAT